MRRYFLLIGFSMLMAGAFAHGAPRASVVQPSALRSTTISYKEGTRTKKKLIYCLGKKTPGTAKNVPTGVLFTPFATSIAKLKAKRIAGSKLTTYNQLLKVGTKACARLKSVIESPTPTPSIGNFDNAGNVTERGKAIFGIPSNLSGNITTGRTVTLTYCTGCHEERIGKNYPFLRTRIGQSPMFFDSTLISDAMLANIVAYLNRFNP